MEIQAIFDNEFYILRHFGDPQIKIKIGRNNQQQYFLLNFFEQIDEKSLIQAREILELDHPSILKLVEIRENRTYQKRNQTETLSCLIYEYPQAGELYEYLIQTGFFNETQTRCYFKQIVEGLIQIHQMGKFHGELLTENIFFADAKTIKIGEYGRSFIKRRNYQFESPEWTEENRNNEQSKDIFALGLILFTCIFGRPPFSSIAFSDPFSKQFYNNPDNFWQFWLAKSQVQITQIDDFKDLIHGMLAFSPSSRYSLSEIYYHPWTQILCEINEQMVRTFDQKSRVVEQFLRMRNLRNQIQQTSNYQKVQSGVGSFYRSIVHHQHTDQSISQDSNKIIRTIDTNLVKLDYHIIENSNPDEVFYQLKLCIDNSSFAITTSSEQFYKLTIQDEEESLIKIELFQMESENIIIISFKRVKGELFTYIENIRELHKRLNAIFSDEYKEFQESI